MDRNELARAQQRGIQQLRQAFASFAGDFATGHAAVIDRFAQKVQNHDLVLWTPPHTLVYEVTNIRPILDPIPGQPIGQIEVTLELTAPVTFLMNTPAMSLIICGKQIAKDHGALEPPTSGTKDNVVAPGQVPEYTALATPPEGESNDGNTGHQ